MYYFILNSNNIIDSITEDRLKLRIKFPNDTIYASKCYPNSIYISSDYINNCTVDE